MLDIGSIKLGQLEDFTAATGMDFSTIGEQMEGLEQGNFTPDSLIIGAMLMSFMKGEILTRDQARELTFDQVMELMDGLEETTEDPK